ncbi:MBL fold metallo-hydrolase [Halalkalibacillus halophilus]|uniref:MBL fold metallo-hydrolase n=1 Tax=Halalkalibacillus halophilus TaxID=392827 RepID=UPI00042291F8|nr:MBL fold metallo-hydrolase [Halalkalibacillus halophilus]
MQQTVDLGNDISLVDLYDLKMPQRTGSYIIDADELTIVETSASPSIPYLLQGLEELNIDPKDVKHLIVTHIHLDHAGGAGLFMEHCPNATVYVHPRGKRHLADPSKLIKGAKVVYGDKFDELFDPIVPIAEERLVEKADGEQLNIGKGRTLTFHDSPGHAKHHFSIHDSKSNGFFTGDTIGVLYPHVKEYVGDFVLPSTSPNQFDPVAMLSSLEKIEEIRPDQIFFGHFGQSSNPFSVYDQIRNWLPIFLSTTEKVLKEFDEDEQAAEAISTQLMTQVKNYLVENGVPPESDVFDLLMLDLDVCAMGLVDYFKKQ